MKILHLTAVPTGGAWIAARRIVDAIGKYTDADVQLLTHHDFGTLPDTEHPPFFFRLKRKVKTILHSLHKTSNPVFYSLGLCGSHLVDVINDSDALLSGKNFRT